jgi:hypothetical protein
VEWDREGKRIVLAFLGFFREIVRMANRALS